MRSLISAAFFFALGYAAGEWLTRRQEYQDRAMDRLRDRLDELETEREAEVQKLRVQLAAKSEADEPTAVTSPGELVTAER